MGTYPVKETYQMTKLSLAGKTAFISGSGQNIGRAIAVHLAKLGCNIVINGSKNEGAARETAVLVEAAGAQSLVTIGDVGHSDAVKEMATAALQHFGTIDILVNNAARRPHKPFLSMTDADWHNVINVALSGSFYTSRAFLPGMVDKGWGRIINFAGMRAMKGYFEGAPISAAKHGVWGLTKALSTEFARKGITANIISPGQIRDENESEDDPSRATKIPTGFMGQPDDIASAVGYLAGPSAKFITGQMIAVNGGETT